MLGQVFLHHSNHRSIGYGSFLTLKGRVPRGFKLINWRSGPNDPEFFSAGLTPKRIPVSLDRLVGIKFRRAFVSRRGWINYCETERALLSRTLIEDIQIT